MKQGKLFTDKIELIQLDTVIGSGYETQVAELALIDKIAYRAARRNMQKHSAIILKINDELRVLFVQCFQFTTFREYNFITPCNYYFFALLM